MIRRISQEIFGLVKVQSPKIQFSYNLSKQCIYQFSQKKKNGFSITDVPKDNLEVKVSSAKLGEELIESFKTKGAVSILRSVPEVKIQSGQLYALNFKCTKCKTQAIRSFTKQAYHEGVVIIHCNGCQNVHLVADNLNWFEDNLASIVKKQSEKIATKYDQVAIVKFIKKVFEQEKHKNNLETKQQQNDMKHKQTENLEQI